MTEDNGKKRRAETEKPELRQMDPATDVEVFDSSIPFQGFFRVGRYRLRHRLFDGSWGRPIVREMFERSHSVAVLPYDPVSDSVVLIEQFRAAAHIAGRNPWLIETIAGMVEDGETPEDVARREAMEEAGCALDGALRPIAGYFTSPGGCTEWVDVFLGLCRADGLGGIHGLPEEGEDIRVQVMTFDAAMAAMNAGRIQASPAVVALHWLALHRDDLRRQALPGLPD